MIVILALLIGAATGALTAKRRGGNTADVLQYGAVYAILFALAGLALTVIVHRVLL